MPGVKLFERFENLVGGGATFGRERAWVEVPRSEIEVTPQYAKTASGTVFAARGVLNLLADSNVSGSSSAWSLRCPCELSNTFRDW